MLEVREITQNDIPLIVDYWLLSDPDHLIGMGVDLDKVPSEKALVDTLTEQLLLPIREKSSYALIWLLNESPIGHCNVNQIEFGEHAYMHLHLWQSQNRQKGIGSLLVKKSLPYFFKTLQLKKIYCEPNALNSAPNRTLEKLGFKFIKKHRCIPGTLNFEQQVNLWELEKSQFLINLGE